MDSDTIWRHIDTQRMALCDLLATLTDEQWRHPSLCADWTVRDVAAHLAMAQVRLREVFVPWMKTGFNSNLMISQYALASPLTADECIATIRGFAGSRRRAPFVSEREPLLDVLIHTQDICIPLGIDHPMPADAVLDALDRVLQLSTGPFRLRPPFQGVRLVATDADWSWGEGETVEGELRWLLLAAAGRRAAHDRLRGTVDAL